MQHVEHKLNRLHRWRDGLEFQLCHLQSATPLGSNLTTNGDVKLMVDIEYKINRIDGWIGALELKLRMMQRSPREDTYTTNVFMPTLVDNNPLLV